MYCSVPRIAPSCVIAWVTISSQAEVAFARSAFARPKSKSCTPFFVTRMLAGFKSDARCQSSAPHPAHPESGTHAPPPSDRQQPLQRLASDILHHQVIRPDTVERTDMWMVQRLDWRASLSKRSEKRSAATLIATMRCKRVSRALYTC